MSFTIDHARYMNGDKRHGTMPYGQYSRLSWVQKVLILNEWNRRNEPTKESALSAVCEWAAVTFNQNLRLSTKSLSRIIRSSNHIRAMA